jgi:hypothetical protein
VVDVSNVEVVELVMGMVPYPVPAVMNYSGYAVIFGYSVKEATGSAAAELDLYGGLAANGQLWIPIPLGPGMSRENWFGPQGVHFRNGMQSVASIGAVTGSIFIASNPYQGG